MDPIVFTAVIIASMFHATWNGMVKKHSNKITAIIDNGTCPRIIAERAVTLFECFLTIPFHVAWNIDAIITAVKTIGSILI